MASIRDVAQLAGVSAAAVSRVLNNDPTFQVPNDTRENILRAANKLQYTIRRSKRTTNKFSESTAIAVILSFTEEQESDRPYYQSIRKGIEKACSEFGIDLVSIIRWNKDSTTQPYLSNIDGVIIIEENPQTELYLSVYDYPRVYVDASPHPTRYDSVVVDLQLGTQMALKHLLDLGHRQIGYLGGFEASDGRCSTFQMTMKEQGIYEERYNFFCNGWFPSDGYSTMQAAIQKGSLPTALFIASDPIAFGALSAIHEAGIRIPENLSIVSFDDVEMASYVHPPLTTVRTYPEEMGRTAVKMLIERLNFRDIPLKVVFPVDLAIRSTTARASRNKPGPQ